MPIPPADKRDADDAIRALDRSEFGYRRRRLRVEWAKSNDFEVKKREETRRAATKPTNTLFVVNFDVERTRERDLEKLFGEFGRLMRVQIKRTYAFIQYAKVEEASDALKELHNSRFAGRTISVEYVAREADGRRPEDEWGGGGGGGGGGYRSRSRSPKRISRSPSYGRRSRSPLPSPRRRSASRSRSPARRSASPRRPPRSRSRSPYRSPSPRRSPMERDRSPA